MLLKRGMGNGEWGMGNGEWGMGNGEWEIEKWEIEKWGMGNLKMLRLLLMTNSIFSAAIITANGRGDLSVSLFQYLSN